MCVCDRERFCQVLYDGCDGVFFCDNAVNLFSVAELRVCKSSLFSVYVFSFSAAQFFFLHHLLETKAIWELGQISISIPF